ncbi:CinA family protein [Flavobacterium sp. MK4S-17]|uniref:CinA family protein n=1 Tax=Flavobacterium sp. MK4S-17 TaxID=2543737 RepID=UPI0013567650|nr:CinA family protein [Flavobacterium sp. MK4S-17]
MASDKIKECSKIIAEKKFTIAFAESATAGWLASEFALVPQSGDIFLGGIVCYDRDTKEELFDIPKETIEKYTAESAEVTQLLAEGLYKYFKSDIRVGVTGLISPGGSETPEKPVGTMFVHIIAPGGSHAHREVFNGEPEEIISKTIDRAADLISNLIS